MTNASAEFEVGTSSGSGGDTVIIKKKHYLAFGVDLGIKVTQHVLSYLYNMSSLYLQSRKLLRQIVLEKVYLQER